MSRSPDEAVTAARFPRLFEPLALRGVTVRNRLGMAPMATHYAQPDGYVTDALCDYLEERARGGFGIVTTENIGVHPAGKNMLRMAMADDDRYLPGLRRIATGIRRHGAVAIAQITHAGRQTSSKVTGHPLVAPSPIPCPLMKEMPRELATDEVVALQDAFASAALRVQEAGFHGVEIHSAHGYLAGSFLSAYSNKRTDEFGGSLENRLRFLTGIVERIRRRAAPDFLLFVRMSVEEFVPDGMDPEQAIVVARQLETRGVDVLSLSVGVYESYNRLTMLSGEPEGPWLERAARVRAATTMAITGVGRIRRPELAEAALGRGQVDLVAIARGSITNPAFPNEARAARGPLVVSCMACNLCLGRAAAPEMVCPVNPFVGRERVLRTLARDDTRTIDVRGGGFAALTAAWLAARRGARVRLLARGDEPAGMQSWRARVPGQAEYRNACAALVARARAAGVELVDADATPRDADATWTVRRWEPVPAAGGAIDATTYEVLRGTAPALPRRVLVAGDDLASVDCALLLAELGHRVTLRSPARDIGWDGHPGFRVLNRRLLANRGARIEVGMPAEALHDRAGFDALVAGRPANVPDTDPAGWRCDFGDPGEAQLADAYEPNALNRGVYAATALALAGTGPR